jgi:hypothetical protein
MSDFAKKIVEIINKVQNKKNSYIEISVNEHDDGGYETVSCGNFKFFIKDDKIAFIINLITGNWIKFHKKTNSRIQLETVSEFYGVSHWDL